MDLSIAYKIAEHIDRIKTCRKELDKIEEIRREIYRGETAALHVSVKHTLIPEYCLNSIMRQLESYWIEAKKQHEKRISELQEEK